MRGPLLFALLVLACAPFGLADVSYALRPGDMIEITVYDEPDLHTITRISSSGEISFPLVNMVSIKGLSSQEVERLLQDRLREGAFIKNPQVTVYVKEFSRQKVYVYGAVAKPGAYEFQQDVPTILKAVAMAGGMTDRGFETAIRVIHRASDRKYTTFTVSMHDLILGKDGVFDVPLDDGDIVSIPEAPPVYVFGEVSKEGIVYFEKDMRILQAVTMAGGFTEKVNRKKVMVLRLVEATGKMQIVNVNFDIIIEKADREANILLQPYDILIAPESWL
ncbi:MAG: SLBB domain-containing protein [Planctomycetota bacterium]